MRVINANLNGQPFLSGQINTEIREFCKTFDIDEPENIINAEKLVESLEENRNQKVLLFSNFPPDSSYPGSGKVTRTTTIKGLEYESWDADSYSKSKSLFEELTGKYNFMAIHFITGAPQEVLSDEMLNSISQLIPVTITRKKEWIHPGHDFETIYMVFMKEKIKEAALKDPFA